MNKKYIYSFILIQSISIQVLFARGGGGSGGGSGARGIGSIISLIFVALFYLFIYLKNKKAKKLISISNTADPFWNYDDMVNTVDNAFRKIQTAWMARDMDLAKDVVTESLYLDFKKQLDWMKVKKEVNMIEDIEIKKIKIIGDEDHNDYENDMFTAYISGKLVDYKLSERTMTIFENSKKKKEPFRDFYYFIRHENKWLLNKIENQVSFTKLMRAKQEIE